MQQKNKTKIKISHWRKNDAKTNEPATLIHVC